jgi:hypothetical protein
LLDIHIITTIKPKRMRWMTHATHKGQVRNAYNVLVENNLKKRSHSGDLGLKRKIWNGS